MKTKTQKTIYKWWATKLERLVFGFVYLSVTCDCLSIVCNFVPYLLTLSGTLITASGISFFFLTPATLVASKRMMQLAAKHPTHSRKHASKKPKRRRYRRSHHKH